MLHTNTVNRAISEADNLEYQAKSVADRIQRNMRGLRAAISTAEDDLRDNSFAFYPEDIDKLMEEHLKMSLEAFTKKMAKELNRLPIYAFEHYVGFGAGTPVFLKLPVVNATRKLIASLLLLANAGWDGDMHCKHDLGKHEPLAVVSKPSWWTFVFINSSGRELWEQWRGRMENDIVFRATLGLPLR